MRVILQMPISFVPDACLPISFVYRLLEVVDERRIKHSIKWAGLVLLKYFQAVIQLDVQGYYLVLVSLVQLIYVNGFAVSPLYWDIWLLTVHLAQHPAVH